MTAHEIVQFLKTNHRDQVCVDECKGGPTWGGGYGRMDLWVMFKKWAAPRVIVYEVKVSKSDFKADDKWHTYLEYCNELYFVCPTGLLQPSDIPDPAGLRWVSPSGHFITKKKAGYRKQVIDEGVYRYILMSRCRITPPNDKCDPMSDKDYFVQWLKNEAIDRDFGRHVSQKIRQVVQQRIEAVEKENHELRPVREFLETLGWVPGAPISALTVSHLILNKGLLGVSAKSQLEQTGRQLSFAIEQLQRSAEALEKVKRMQSSAEAVLEEEWRAEIEHRILYGDPQETLPT